MTNEPIDVEYWRDVEVFTVWQAAFAMCHLEPWDEPILTTAKPPDVVEKMRTTLLANIAHYQTGQVFAQSGWSCKTQRPIQLSGLYFSRQSLADWAAVPLLASQPWQFLER
ncbi:MAG: hypothetical protein COB26_08025 [Piscirickettsiaceae bacterium]|nr:MAG: hypothetical protein COB26_08025 [Piscirickettsiaceae bacterium]